MFTPKISIIIPCYNQAKYIDEALDSVFDQTLSEWECIVVDDGSTDDSVEHVMRYIKNNEHKIKLLKQANAGPSAARNCGAKEARAKYLFFLDGDNKLAPDYLETGVRYMDEHQETSLFYSRINFFGGAEGEFKLRYVSYESLLFNNSIDCGCIVRKVDFDRVGGFDEQMHGYEDWEFFIRLLYKNDQVYQEPRKLFYYRKNVNPMSVNVKAKAKHEALTAYIYHKHQDKFVELFGTPYRTYFNAYLYKMELDKLLTSNAYIIGKKIVAPLKWLKKKHEQV